MYVAYLLFLLICSRDLHQENEKHTYIARHLDLSTSLIFKDPHLLWGDKNYIHMYVAYYLFYNLY